MSDGVDYEAWAVDLCTLLDRIELANDDSEIATLLDQRFALAEKHSMSVHFGHETSGKYN